MAKPVILAVDDDPQVLAIGTQLLRYLAVSGFFITVALS